MSSHCLNAQSQGNIKSFFSLTFFCIINRVKRLCRFERNYIFWICTKKLFHFSLQQKYFHGIVWSSFNAIIIDHKSQVWTFDFSSSKCLTEMSGSLLHCHKQLVFQNRAATSFWPERCVWNMTWTYFEKLYKKFLYFAKETWAIEHDKSWHETRKGDSLT